MIFLTVFTPAYNRASTLPRTYESLCDQECKEFIWLIVDDGSTDETASLVKEWQKKENGFEIQYIYKKNGGMHTAHNVAYENIHTELNVCIDSDDRMAKGAVKKIKTAWLKVRNKNYAGLIGLNYDAVEDCWAITTPHDDSIDKRKTCGIGPNLYIWDKGNTIVFWEDFTYMGSSELDIYDIILRGGDYKYTYVCDYDNSDYGYDKELGKWFAWATFEMEDSEVEWLRNLLSADTVIMRFEGTDYSKFDYTWTVQDRQAITDIIDLYNLLKAVTPEVREKALRN